MKKFLNYYKPHMKLFLLDMVAAFTLSAIDLIFPVFSRTIIDDFIPNNKITQLFHFAGIIFLLYIVRMACNYIMGYWGHVMGARIEHDMRRDLFSHVQNLPFKFFDNTKTGKLMSRIINDLNEMSELAHHGPEDLFISVLMIGGSLAIMFTINGTLAMVVMALVVAMIVFTINTRLYMVRTFRRVRKGMADINARVETSLSGVRLSKSFANEDYEIDRFAESNGLFRNAKNDSFRAIGIFTAGNHFLADLLNVVVITIGGYYVYLGKLTYGDLMAFVLYTAFFLRPIRRLIQFIQQYQSGMSGYERFCELMDTMPEIEDAPDAETIEDVQGRIEFKGVSFKYEADLDDVLHDFDLDIEPGKTVALVGPSGVGKTTIANLIPRFYEVSGGSIVVDGVDIRRVTQQSLRKNIGIVQQDVFIFFGSIGENIAYGKPGATDEEIIQAAKHANIHDFIESLDEGYETIVGERGVKLSGGQKQRIAIARVFLKNPPILILDEATSALDNQNELAIQKSIEELSENRTTIVIAHRLSTIKNADEILVLDDGGVAERGSHDVLIGQNGLYASLYHAQFRGLIPDMVTGR
ncbi:MAG: ABC transporter ATP-binding protein [Clostridia bacterium]|nr:ABC transporter ATP-binding protein [Clostridia bacterium]